MTREPRILHVMGLDKFIPAFIDMIEEYFDFSCHRFFIMGDDARYPVIKRENILFMHDYPNQWRAMLILIREMHAADKIIVHGLFSLRTIVLLFLQPWLLRRCYWGIWGGDLYVYQLGKRDLKWHVREFLRRPVIRNMGHLLTYVSGDVELARKWYGAKGHYHECIGFPSNVYSHVNFENKLKDFVSIQVGNSADPSNNHAEVFEMLGELDDGKMHVYCPLSYGDLAYADHVEKEGKGRFGVRFHALRGFLPFDQYLEYLSSIDVAIFNHRRQQAMGNILTLLGMGKKVYMSREIATWHTLEDLGLKVFDVASVKIERNSDADAAFNINKLRQYFNKENLVRQWELIFRL